MSKKKQRATEIEWLKWFYSYADFGPADSDVRAYMEDRFRQETGKLLPEGYNCDPETGEPRDDL